MPVQVIKKEFVDRPYPVVQEKIVHVDRPVEKIVHVDRPVEKIVHVDRPVPVEKIVHVPVEKIVEKEVSFVIFFCNFFDLQRLLIPGAC